MGLKILVVEFELLVESHIQDWSYLFLPKQPPPLFLISIFLFLLLQRVIVSYKVQNYFVATMLPDPK